MAADRSDLAEQLLEAVLDRHTYDTSCDAIYLSRMPGLGRSFADEVESTISRN